MPNGRFLLFLSKSFMKNYAKVGRREGRPAFRTPSPFRYRQFILSQKEKAALFKKIKRRGGANPN
jgi:hypothetical protein